MLVLGLFCFSMGSLCQTFFLFAIELKCQNKFIYCIKKWINGYSGFVIEQKLALSV
ncbi:hypothetical protein HMPREF9370_0843 [Neisseria wadsworthii 9715]|uniref:Uncharacterized protein n=1 Tax=Neisseria wadsworthii 9715 TaxID=1030841 RepID=G4CP34_9NEIS|nr:hypothetical protein HMPREF9370_0843 [Neisseria wadsworthii 9715]